MVLPIVIITTMEALRAVPNEHPRGGLRRRGHAVGGGPEPRPPRTRRPGVLTGSVLALARAFGETAPLIMVGAVTGFLATAGRARSTAPGRLHGAPDAHLRLGQEAQQEFQDLAAAAILVLMVVIFVVNLAAILLRNRYERKW